MDICDVLLYLCDECNNYTIKFQLYTEKVEIFNFCDFTPLCKSIKD